MAISQPSRSPQPVTMATPRAKCDKDNPSKASATSRTKAAEMEAAWACALAQPSARPGSVRGGAATFRGGITAGADNAAALS